jgi:hypothetical protein
MKKLFIALLFSFATTLLFAQVKSKTKPTAAKSSGAGYDKKEYPDEENADNEKEVNTANPLLQKLGDILKLGESNPDNYPAALQEVLASEGFAFKDFQKNMSEDGKYVDNYVLNYDGLKLKYGQIGGIMKIEMRLDKADKFAQLVKKIGHSTESYGVTRNSKANAFFITYMPL